MTHYLTRAVLNRSAPEHALRPLIDPADKDAAFDAHHRLIWTLFSGASTNRDFIWRADEGGKFYILSAREPQASRLFKPLESKRFEPELEAGDRLQFVLRANATRDRRSVNGESVRSGTRRTPAKGRRVDIVMHAMHEQGLVGGLTGVESRASRRMELANAAAGEWLNAQGERRGFSVDAPVVDDYRITKLKRGKGSMATFGILDLRGVLTVRDPEKFSAALISGFGRSKAFGCGLMLVRRA